ncbi:Hypothetical predicted protein [Olea europaea subsp. europaea]|uniref:Uncharacterized protein n=1 Tax=Olea europaea subsp. europaea TaxID=158383 RepID=A0A8S0R2Q5_OLEEU|nr:Hypothetical predicted protein [Olea europaea subsp. europaea]
MVIDYVIGQIIEETAFPLEYSRANAPRRQANIFDKLGTTKKDCTDAHLTCSGQTPSYLPEPATLFNPLSVGNQHGQLQSEIAVGLAHRDIHPRL